MKILNTVIPSMYLIIGYATDALPYNLQIYFFETRKTTKFKVQNLQ